MVLVAIFWCLAHGLNTVPALALSRVGSLPRASGGLTAPKRAVDCFVYTHVCRPCNSTNLDCSVHFGAAKQRSLTTSSFSISFCIFLWIKVRWSCSIKIENGPFASSPTRMQDRMEHESIKIRFNKILVANEVHGEVIDSKLILSQNVKFSSSMETDN